MVTASTSVSRSTSSTTSNVSPTSLPSANLSPASVPPSTSSHMSILCGEMNPEMQNASLSKARVEIVKSDNDEIIQEYECDTCNKRFPHHSDWKAHARREHIPIDMRDRVKYDFFTVIQRLKR